MCYSAIPLYKNELDFGKLMRKYVPEAKSMPQYRQFREKYLQGTWPRGPTRILMKLCKIKDNVLNNNKKIKIATDIKYKVNLLHRVITKMEINKKVFKT